MIGPAWAQGLAFGAGLLLQQKALELEAAPGVRANFQPYIFWAYGLACGLLCLLTLWTALEMRRLGDRIHYLSERFQRAHPEEAPRAAD